MKAKKGKKTLLSRPLVPWPPRQGPVPAESNTLSLSDLIAVHTTSEHKTEASWANRNAEALAVKSQSGRASVPIDGPCTAKRSSFAPETMLSDNTVDDTNASDEHRFEGSTDVDQIAANQHHVRFDAAVVEHIHIAESSTIPDSQSSYASHEGLDRVPQTQEASLIDGQAPDGSPLVSGPTASLPNSDLKLRPLFAPASNFRAKHSGRRTSSSTVATDHETTSGPPSRLGDEQEVLHGACSRPRPIRVTKALRKARTIHETQLRTPAAAEGSQAPPKMTALDAALDTLRNACLVDQYRMEDQMTTKLDDLKAESTQLRNTQLDHLSTIAGLRAQLNTSNERFSQLNEKARLNQKYISGLQKDHEKLQKSVSSSHEQNRKALRDQIDELLEEKAMLQGELELAIASSTKAQKAMVKTMSEIHMHYVMALSREKGLKDRLDERTSMYEEEKSRRVELEKQLLPSVQSMQLQLNESSTVLVDKFGSLRANLESHAAEDGNNCSIKACLLILQKLESLPLLTSIDVRKAEGMLRFLYER